jgi:membrane protease YdiL (CAAX protease family)
MPSPTLMAALEGFLAMFLCFFAGSLAKGMVLERVEPGLVPDVGGLAQALGVLLALVVVYGPRFRPAAPTLPAAWAGVAHGLARTLVPSLCWEALALLVLHAAQVVLADWWWRRPEDLSSSPSPPSSSSLSLLLPSSNPCSTTTAVVWAPLFEEAVFRVVLFYVVLQRSGGNAGLAGLTSACTFGGIHLANVAAAGAADPYAWLQVAAGAACGAAWVLVFACTGSLTTVAALHAANNAAAVAWSGAAVRAGAAAACPGQGQGQEGSDVGWDLVASLTLQLGVYAIVALAAWRRLHGLVSAEGEGRGDRFRVLHPVVYGGGREGEVGRIKED